MSVWHDDDTIFEFGLISDQGNDEKIQWYAWKCFLVYKIHKMGFFYQNVSKQPIKKKSSNRISRHKCFILHDFISFNKNDIWAQPKSKILILFVKISLLVLKRIFLTNWTGYVPYPDCTNIFLCVQLNLSRQVASF